MIRWIKRVILGVLASAIAVSIVVAMLPKPVSVDTATVTLGPLEVEIREDGQTRVRDRFVVAAPIAGQLARIEIEPGNRVTAGQVIATILPLEPALLDDRTRGEATARLTAARVRERQATTAVARAGFARDAAARDATRSRKLEAGGALSAQARERAELTEQLAVQDLAAAELQRAAAAAEADAMRVTLEPRHAPRAPLAVTAPTAGSVLRVLRVSAGPVSAGTPLVELADPARLEVVIDVLSRDAERIAPGMDIEIETTSAVPVRGIVRLVEPAAFTRLSALGVEEQRVNVIADLGEAAASLGDAYRVDARIILWRSDRVLRVPSSALFRDRGEWAVYVIDGDRARIRRVNIAHRGRLDVEVTGGLEAGTHVIVHPGDRVTDGARARAR